MSEERLVEQLTDVCEWAKQKQEGFVWLTHIGHWRRPEIVAVFETEAHKARALSNGWYSAFVEAAEFACEAVKGEAKSFRFESEQACNERSGGNWAKHLQNGCFHYSPFFF